MNRYNKILKELNAIGQEHLLAFYDCLSNDEKVALLNQIERSDLSVVKYLNQKSDVQGEAKIEPINVMTIDKIAQSIKTFDSIGVDAIKNGKVAAVLLAGGQGTRLGVDKSKGMVDIGITRSLYIFECLFNNIMDVVRKAKTWIHFYIMTSDINNSEIIEFLKEHKYFGYDENYVHFFTQEMLPAVDMNGKFILSEKGALASSPNGNGGWFSSLYNSGLFNDLKNSGAEWLNCFSVDNVLQRIADPIFLGATIDGSFECGAKVIKKSAKEEKVGHICLKNSKPSIIEYYEMTDDLLNQKDKDGQLAFDYGVTLNYLFKLDKLEQTLKSNMPIHVVKKKVPYVDSNGKQTIPQTENGFKFETLILDMVEMLGDCLPFEIVREKEFAPIKNKDGVDSIITAQKLLKENNIVL